MSLKKSLTRFVCGSMVFASLFQNFAYAENVETKNVETNKQTIISMMDLNNIEQNVNVSSYLIDIENGVITKVTKIN